MADLEEAIRGRVGEKPSEAAFTAYGQVGMRELDTACYTHCA